MIESGVCRVYSNFALRFSGMGWTHWEFSGRENIAHSNLFSIAFT